jgi:hypothetical protein
MPITLNNSNISIQYNTGSNYIIDTVKSDIYIINQREQIVNNIITNNLQTAPVTPTTYVDNSGNVYAVESYTYSGSANTKDYTRVFPKNTTCDILIVGGGGGGGGSYVGGGGGAGGYVYIPNFSFNGSYSIKVGRGGNSRTHGIVGENGQDSSFGIYTAIGGGGGASNPYPNTTVSASSGGSGGGGTTLGASSPIRPGGSSTQIIYTSPIVSKGSAGRSSGTVPNRGGGGGGSGILEGDTANGTSGIVNDITGNNVFYAAGGGGGTDGTTRALGGSGIGGNGGIVTSGSTSGTSGTSGTGSGGGGSGGIGDSGAGGSGIVIIRYLLGNVNYLTPEPSIILPTFTESIRTFIHSGGAEAQTSYNITVGQNTICDILIVGGGGAGGTYIGGGGGGGGVLYITNCTIPVGTYNIQVGKGGTGVSGGASGTTAQNGSSSKAFGIEVFGGGYGGVGQWGTSAVSQLGANGGSGGGGGSAFNVTPGTGGTVIQPSFTSSVITVNNYNYYGGNGASGILYNNNSFGSVGANGGGGAGGNAPSNTDQINAGAGADGIAINITGTSYFWGGGGGGGQYGGTANGKAGNGGKGGGGGGSGSQVPDQVGIGGIGGITLGQDGDLEGDGAPTAGNGGAGTGGGGGGCGRTTITPNAVSGSGGSGIVIIKFKSTTSISEGNPITHKRLNFTYNNDNLVAWYRFNGDYLDSSGNGNNLTNVGSVIQSTHIIEGQAVEFDSTDYLEFPATINPYTIWNGKGITFSFWVRYTTNGLWARLFDFQTASNSTSGILIAFKESSQNLRIHVTSSYYFDTVIVNSGTWNHIVWCIDVTGKWDIYLNNVRINNNEVQGIPNITYNFRYIRKSASTNDGTWDGQMDDFRIYDRVLSATDVSMLYNKTYPIPNLYTLNFPVPTVADINNNSNIVLRGAYDISLTTTSSLIIPKAGQHIPRPTTFSTSNMSIRYNVLGPTRDPIGAQWTYNSSNTSVYHMGSVGIGTTNPEYQLDVRGNIFSSTGGFTQSGLTTWTVLSDSRIKENIVKASYDKCLENVKNIELYNFNFKENYVSTNDRHQLGFIAQEVQEVYPKAVDVSKITINASDANDAIENILTLNTTQIDYTLYGAVKNLIEKIEDIELSVEKLYISTISSNIDNDNV